MKINKQFERTGQYVRLPKGVVPRKFAVVVDYVRSNRDGSPAYGSYPYDSRPAWGAVWQYGSMV